MTCGLHPARFTRPLGHADQFPAAGRDENSKFGHASKPRSPSSGNGAAGSDLSPLAPLLDAAASLAAQHLEVEASSILELLPTARRCSREQGRLGRRLVGRITVGAGTASQAGYALLSREPVIVTDLGRETRFTAPPLLHDHQVVSG